MHAIGWMNEWMEEDPIKGMQSERALELLVFQSVMQESGIRNECMLYNRFVRGKYIDMY